MASSFAYYSKLAAHQQQPAPDAWAAYYAKLAAHQQQPAPLTPARSALAMPPKRPAELEAATEQNKKFRSAIDAVADDWVCPITCELPIDPVVAEDGRVYERAAIQEHIDKKGVGLKSPMTNVAMGPRLLPSAQARSTIEKLVRTGAISGDKAELWRERIEEEEEVEKLRERAEGGDTVAMCDLGADYAQGRNGLAKDYSTAFKWYKRAADANNPFGMAAAALCLVEGVGVQQNTVHGMALASRAAEMGSDLAAYYLGAWYDKGAEGLPQDKAHAAYWYERVASATHTHMTASEVERAAERVRELRASS